MLKKLWKGEHGDLSFFTVFVILAINMLMAFLLLFASIRIECINIRNAAKMELNNVSARIYADTFHSQREANLDSYMEDLHFSSDYQEALRSDFIQGLADRIPMEKISAWTSDSMAKMTEKSNMSFPVMPSSGYRCLGNCFLRFHFPLP